MTVRSKARITAKGQITLPVAVRKRLGVERGDEVTFELGGEVVTIAPGRAVGQFQKYAGKFRAGHGRSTAAIDAFVRTLRGPR